MKKNDLSQHTQHNSYQNTTMMSFRSLLLVVFLLVATSAQEEGCKCDDAVAAAKENASKEKDAIAAQLASVETQIQSAQGDLAGCQTKVTETNDQAKSKEADYNAKIEALKKEKQSLEGKTAELDALNQKLEQAKQASEAAAKKASDTNDQMKSDMEKERALLKKAEESLVNSHRDLLEASEQITALKEMKNKKYFNVGGVWADLVAKVTGKEAEKAEL